MSIHGGHAGTGNDATDARHRDVRGGCFEHRFAHAGRRAETQFVVVAAGGLQPSARLAVEARCATRATPATHPRRPRADAACLADMAEVRQQAIRDIDAGGRDAAQRASKRHPRRRPVQAQAQAGSIAPPACHCDSAAAASPSVPLTQRSSPTRAPSRRNAWPGSMNPCTATQTDNGPRVVSPPTKRDIVVRGEREEAVQEPVDEAGHPHRAGTATACTTPARAHRGEVGQVHRQRLPADVGGRGFRREMHAAVERVHRHRQLHAGRWLQQRGIVADAEHHVAARRDAPADALDQVEFGDRAVPPPFRGSARARRLRLAAAQRQRRPCPARR
jgi:hypothetical protein